jgi:hypothetical protein
VRRQQPSSEFSSPELVVLVLMSMVLVTVPMVSMLLLMAWPRQASASR